MTQLPVDPENIEMSLEIRQFLALDGSDEHFFDQVLGRMRTEPAPYSGRADNIGIEHAIGGEVDRLEAFHLMMSNLRQLCGSDRSAVRWLMYSRSFASIGSGGGFPFEFIANGDFWALALMTDLTSIALQRPGDPEGVADTSIFGFNEFENESA